MVYEYFKKTVLLFVFVYGAGPVLASGIYRYEINVYNTNKGVAKRMAEAIRDDSKLLHSCIDISGPLSYIEDNDETFGHFLGHVNYK